MSFLKLFQSKFFKLFIYSLFFISHLFVCVLIWDESFCRAEIAPLFTGSLVAVNPSLMGGELGASLLAQPDLNHAFWIGPRVGGMWAAGSSESRLDLQFGAEGILWLANAVGMGLDSSVVYPSQVYVSSENYSNSVHYRVTPSLSVRFFQFEKEGAWAVRLAIPYDSLYHWGFQVGVSLQLNGVARVGL